MIQPLTDMLQALGVGSLDVLWLPLAAWTILAAPIYFALCQDWPRPPLLRYRTLQALLLVLPVGIAVAAATDFLSLLADRTAPGAAAPALITLPAVSTAAPEAAALSLWNGYVLLGGATILAGLLALWRMGRLGLHAAAMTRFQQAALPEARASLQRKVQRLASDMGIRRTVRVAVLPRQDLAPMTFGGRRPVILIPSSLQDHPDALEMALHHELVHIRHRDYLMQWIEQTVGALFFIHPLTTLLRRSIATCREMACDAEVVGAVPSRRGPYARLLYHYAQTTQPRPFSTIGITKPTHHLKERLHAMKSYTPFDWNAKYVLIGLAGFLLAGTTLIAACSDMVDVQSENADPAPTVQKSQQPGEEDVFVVTEDMPELLPDRQTAMQNMMQEIQYPEAAKKAGKEGRVIVQFIVDEEGSVTSPQVLQGKGDALDAEAIRVVETLHFKPGMQKGQPVKAKMALPINFKLQNNDSASAQSGEQAAMQVTDLQRTGEEITGQILETGSSTPLAGASVVVKGDEKLLGAATDSQGRFTILLPSSAPEDLSMQVSHPNHQPIQIMDEMPQVTVQSSRE